MIPMLDINKPMEAIEDWQKWYRNHQPVVSSNEVLINDDAKTKWIEKAKEHFADTLAEYQYELSGKDFYKAFYQAAYENLEAVKKEYERAKELVDMLRYHHLGQD